MGLSGAIFGVDPVQAQRQQAYSDAFRQQKIQETMAASNNIHKSIALLLDPNTMQPLPGKEADVAQLRTQLGQLDGYVKNLYNPKFDPQTGAITEDPIHKLTDKLHLTHAPAQPYTDYAGAPQPKPVSPGTVTTPVNKTAGQQLSDLQDITARFSAAAPDNPYLIHKRQQVQAGATPEQAQQSLEISMGIEPKATADKSSENWQRFDAKLPDGRQVTLMQNTKDGRITDLAGKPVADDLLSGAQLVPKTPPRPKTQYDQQKEEFAKSLGKTVDQLTWPEEQEFIKKRNPFGSARLGIAYEQLKLTRLMDELKQNDSDFKAFETINKQLSPLEKIQTAAANADQYTANPSGPGDVALVFAFIEATKPSSGFRFTETERKWILGSRGIVDGAMTRIQQGFTGETLAPEQRAQMTQIIKTAGSQVQQESNKLLQSAAQFKPKAAAAASTEVNGKKRVSLKKAMALPQNKGKSEAQVRADIESHNYEVAP